MKITHKSIMANDDWDIDWDKLWEISDRYIGDEPISGDWTKEIEHEQRAISRELGVSMDMAKELMIDHLQIPESAFVNPLAASIKIKSATNSCNVGVAPAVTDEEDIMSARDEFENAELLDMTYSTVEADEDVDIADDVEEVIIDEPEPSEDENETSDSIDKEYIDEIISAVKDAVAEVDPNISVEFKEIEDDETAEDSIVFTLTEQTEDESIPDINVYEVPYEDLSMDIDKDLEYITSNITEINKEI